MSLATGTRIGPYEITGAIGAGGMGEVFRARDTKLNRDVAIKVLPAAFADDPERLARFTREAQTLASLNHPNIAAIYGIEEIASSPSQAGLLAMTEGTRASRALVMELVEGEDLSTQLTRGPIPVAEALPIARQIAEALEAAHEQGIVHRDLKPANIKVRADGAVKVLDFGLAKAMDSAGSRSGPANSQLSHSPTMSRHMTEAGMIMGTAAYMSPEQARGKPVDKRTDVWAFGCVLYEMLSGRRAFDGEDATEIISAVVKSEPEWRALPENLPEHLRGLVTGCLVKDRRARISDLSVVRYVLDGSLTAASAPATSPAITTPAWRRALPWALAVVFAVALTSALLMWAPWRPPVPPTPIQFTLSPPAGTSFSGGPGFISVSPDGRQLAYFTGPQGDTRLWLRSLDSSDARPVPAASGGWHLAWSPDGRSVVFTPGAGSGPLKRVDFAGGPAQTLSESPVERSAWSSEGVVLFTPREAPQRLMRVPATGGRATPVTEVDVGAGETSHAWPVFLRDGKRFIFLARNRIPGKSALFLGSLDSMERKHLLDVHSMVDVAPGFLVYHRDGTLYAHPFDEASAGFTGDPVAIVEGVQFNASNGRAAFGTSRTGLLAYRTGELMSDLATLSWLDRTGKVLGTIGQPGAYYGGALSPDGRRYVVSVADEFGTRDLVMIDLDRNLTSRFTTDPGIEDGPVWTNDGKSVIFSSDRNGPLNLYVKNAGGGAPEQVLFESPDDKYADSISPDGKLLLFTSRASEQKVWVVPVAGGAAPRRLFPDEPEKHANARFSPDGKWVAYNTVEAIPQVFVQPFPPNGYREQISATQGKFPKWSADGRTIAFVGDDARVLTAEVRPAGDRLRVSAPRELFLQTQRRSAIGFAMDARAERFLLAVVRTGSSAAPSEASAEPLRVIVNWPSLLHRK